MHAVQSLNNTYNNTVHHACLNPQKVLILCTDLTDKLSEALRFLLLFLGLVCQSWGPVTHTAVDLDVLTLDVTLPGYSTRDPTQSIFV